MKYTKKRRREAATLIQRYYKGYVARIRYKEQKRRKREDWLSGRMRARKKVEVTLLKAKINDRFRKRCGASKIGSVLWKLVRQRLSHAWKKWTHKRLVIYSLRGIVRIQAWYRGWKVRFDLKKMSIERHVGPDDLERLRRIRREAFHTNASLAESPAMAMVTRTLKRREADDHDRLKR